MIVKGSLPAGLAGVDQDAARAALTEAVRRALLHRVPRNDEELYNYFGRVHGFWLARHPCCDGHRAPLEFIADAFFQRRLRLLAMASKGSGKTQDLALLHLVNSRFKAHCWTAHMGASQQQADRCYDYFLREVQRPEIAKEVEGVPIRKETRFRNQSKVEVLTATIGQASGPHEQIGAADEFEQFDLEVWDHWSKTPHESHGIKAQMILASTRFELHGPVTRVIDQLGDALAVYPWCVWDVMQRCTYDCKKLPPAAGEFAGRQCPLYEREIPEPNGGATKVPLCAGKAHHANGHLSWDEIVSQFLLSTQGSFAVLQTLDEPGKEGLFFPECDSVRHRSSAYQYVPGEPVYLGYDDGFGFPLALGAWQVRKDGTFYCFDGLYGARKPIHTVLAWLSTKEWLKDVAIGWPDPSGQAAIEEFREFFKSVLGRPVMVTDADNSRVDGWNVVRRRLRGPLGGVLIGFGPGCPPEIWNDLAGLASKEGTEDCEKKQDHGADMVRYLCRNLERYLGVQDAWNEDKRPEGQFDIERKAREVQAEDAIKRQWDRLRGLGITEDRLREAERNHDGTRADFARALADWVSQHTMKGRLQRAGLAPEDEDDL